MTLLCLLTNLRTYVRYFKYYGLSNVFMNYGFQITKNFRARIFRMIDLLIFLIIFFLGWLINFEKLKPCLLFLLPVFEEIFRFFGRKYRLKYPLKISNLIEEYLNPQNTIETEFYTLNYSIRNFSLSNNSNVFPQFNPDFFINTNLCPSCNFISHPFQTANSNEKDLILLFSFSKFINVDVLVRSIRSANCHATIFIQTNDIGYNQIKSNPFYAKLSRKCGLYFQVLPFPRLSFNGKYLFKLFVRLSFLSSPLGQTFKRVLFIDAFDSFLQGDPFFQEMRNDTIYFSAEDDYFIHDEIKAFNTLLNEREKLHLKEIEYYHMVNGAVYLGYITPMIDFLLFMFDGHVEYKDFESQPGSLPQAPFKYDDQILLNMVLFGDIKRKPLPVKYHIFDPNFTICIHLATFRSISKEKYLGKIKFKNGSGYPPILHQINRHPVGSSTYDVCPK